MLIATAGHVDHGKTSVVKALTGVNTDRLDEEKRRGLTIELGFAYKSIDDNNTLGFIDVPGHHRFMNTMISGVTGIDLGMLVVAADDGPMPQTLEHLQILRLLGVSNFLAIITKIDMVDDSRIEDVAAQIHSLLPGVQICKISTKVDTGVNRLLEILHEKAAACHKQRTGGHFRMYIDRVFTKKGSGLLVTGTALSGKVNISDELWLHSTSGAQSRKFSTKVRSIHAQGHNVQSGHASQRCALNLTGKVSIDNVRRGDILCADVTALPASRLDTRFWPAENTSLSLKHMGRVKLYIGSRRLDARTYLLNRKDPPVDDPHTAGQIVQFVLDEGVLAFAEDRFLVRDDSEHNILGGGLVVDPAAGKWGKERTDSLKRLKVLEENNPQNALTKLVYEKGEIVSLKRHQRIWNWTDCEVEHVLSGPAFTPESLVRLSRKGDELILSADQWGLYTSKLIHILTDWHTANRQAASLAINGLQALAGTRIPANIFADILNSTIRDGQIAQSENQVCLAGYKPQLTLRADEGWKRLEALMQGRLPLRSEIERELGFDARKIEALTRSKLKGGTLYEIGEKRLALPSTLLALAGQIFQLYQAGPFTIINAKNTFELGRGQTIEILEFFDTIKYTTRLGNTRSIVNPDIAEQVLKR